MRGQRGLEFMRIDESRLINVCNSRQLYGMLNMIKFDATARELMRAHESESFNSHQHSFPLMLV